MKYPIIQAPMAGGNATPALVHEVSEAGGLGFLAAGYKTIDALKEEIHSVRRLGTTEFGVNLFVPNEATIMTSEIATYYQKLEVEAKKIDATLGKLRFFDDDFERKMKLCMELRVPIVSFTFNCPHPKIIARMKRAGITTILTVTTVEEALIGERAGIDCFCAQGIEAGGHRASFDDGDPAVGLTTEHLLRKLKRHIALPIIVAGGIMDGHRIRTLLECGADGVQLGTAFLCCPESGTNPLHVKSLLDGAFHETIFTRAYTGRYARGLKNTFIDQFKEAPKAYPELHYATAPMRKRAIVLDRSDLAAMWAGVNFQQIRVMPAKQLIDTFVEEAGYEFMQNYDLAFLRTHQ